QRDALIKQKQAAAAVSVAEAGVAAADATLKKARLAKQLAQKAIDATKDFEIGKVKRVELEGAVDLAELNITAAEKAVALAQSQVELAKSKLAEANLGLELTTIRAPMSDGSKGRPKRKFTILKREVEPRQNVDTKLPLFVLTPDPGEMRAHALIPESQISRV